VKSYGWKNAISMRVFQLPAQSAQTGRRRLMRDGAAERARPRRVDYRINYDPTRFVRQSFKSVLHTLLEAIALVVLVVVLFLQTWRASIIPLIAVPVSLIGTFAVMKMFGSSLNNLSLFGIVLAIGIVVDDAIVVVENVERYLAKGLSRRDATLKAMSEVSGALVAIALVLCAVFVPTAFLGGITGQFYRQFALTIATATVISAFNALTLSPALAALLLKENHGADTGRKSWLARLIHGFFAKFNAGFERLSQFYSRIVRGMVRHTILALIGYAALIGLTIFTFTRVPGGFIPAQDMGYFLVVVQLPDGASFNRTDEVVRRVDKIGRATPGIAHTFAISGYSSVLQANQSNYGAAFFIPDDFEKRRDPSLSSTALMATLREKFASIKEARVSCCPPPPLRGLGKLRRLQDPGAGSRRCGLAALEAATRKLMDAWQRAGLHLAAHRLPPEHAAVFRRYRSRRGEESRRLAGRYQRDAADEPRLGLCETTFNLFGRTYQVFAMAEPEFAMIAEDVARLQTRNRAARWFARLDRGRAAIGGVDRVQRYNMFTSADVNGNTQQGRQLRADDCRTRACCRRATAGWL
jgi:multidrug efflux pump